MIIKAIRSSVNFIVDDKHYERLSKFRWSVANNGAIYRSVRLRDKYTKNGHNKVLYISLPNEIFNTVGILYDHKDRNYKNNLEENLRPCNRTQNNQNKSKKQKASSAYKGVYKAKHGTVWASAISLNKKRKFLGYFKTEADAALAYNKMAIELFGEFAVLNVI